MNRLKSIQAIRKKLSTNKVTVGSWMQIPDSSLAEIIGQMGFDWVAVDLEHGSIDLAKLPDIFRALELGNTLPIVRLAHGDEKDCKHALDAGASGVIIPMVNNSEKLKNVIDYCKWPPSGKRGIAFSRANLFGYNFESYKREAQKPLIIAMIEDLTAVQNLNSILSVKGLDAILIGPYDLSASIGDIANFSSPVYVKTKSKILKLSKKYNIPAGIHIVEPTKLKVSSARKEGYQFIACSMDSVMIRHSAQEYLSFFKKR
jgi:2-dehydro-3-deoxyglucarate aldolase